MNQQTQRINFNELSFQYPNHTIKIGEYIIPIKVHVGDIYLQETEELDLGLIGKDDVMSFEFEKNKKINSIKKDLKFVNVEDKIFNNFKQNFLEYHNLKSIDELIEVFDDMDFMKLKLHLSGIISEMISLYRVRLYNMLKLDEETPYIGYKPENDMSQNIKDYLNYTNGYMISQSFIEFNSIPFFKENKNKAVEEMSFRELELRLAYMTMKHRTESVQNEWQMKQVQDNKPKK